MGIEQFGHLPNKYAFIEQYMLPTKKKQQLRYRLKNLKADRTTGENTIKVNIDPCNWLWWFWSVAEVTVV